ncbi:PH domain-containing protein, partial [Frankia sp. EI5c]
AAVTGVRCGTLNHGRRLVHVHALEIETIDGPVLLSRWQLGADPERVAAVIEEYRAHLG